MKQKKAKKTATQSKKQTLEQLLENSAWKDEILKMPTGIQKLAVRAYEAYDKQNVRNLENYTNQILGTGIDPASVSDLRKKLADLLFQRDFDAQAERIYRELLAETPGDTELTLLLGFALFSQEKKEEALEFWKLLPDTGQIPEQYRLRYYYAYSGTLMQLEKIDEAVGVLRAMTEDFTGHPELYSDDLRHGQCIIPYGNILMYDIEQKFDVSHDLQNFLAYLQTVEFDEMASGFLTSVLISFDAEAENEEFREVYRQLLDDVSENQYLSDTGEENILQHGYHLLESFLYEKDDELPMILRAYLNDGYEYAFIKNELNPEHKYYVRAYGQCGKWYCAKYFLEYPETFKKMCSYISEKYPHTWRVIEKELTSIQADPEQCMKQVEREMLPYFSVPSVSDMRANLEEKYQKMLAGEHEYF